VFAVVIAIWLVVIVIVGWPLLGLATTVAMLVDRSTRWLGILSVVLSAAAVLLAMPWLSWAPVLSFADRSVTLVWYFLCAVPVWAVVLYSIVKLRQMISGVTSGDSDLP
jgi:hypothetical protein